MTSTSQNIPSDSLPSTVPKLDPTGTNWAIFSIHFEEALSTRGQWGHFDGSVKRPVAQAKPPSKDEQEKIDEWDKEELTTHYMLSQKLPDSVVQICKLTTVAEKWKLVEEEFMHKGLLLALTCITPLWLHNAHMVKMCDTS